jgi:RNA polymerase sigma-B factor
MPADTDLRTAELFRHIAGTDDQEERRRLQQEVVVLNLPLARGVAARYVGRGESFEDLYQVACFALVKAVRNFDTERDRAFYFYAMPSMHGEVKRHFRDHSWAIRPPRHVQDSRDAVNDAVEKLTQELQREPTADEIAGVTGLEPGTVAECLASRGIYRVPSIDAPRPAGEPASDAGDALALDPTVLDGDDPMTAVENRLTLRPLIADLSPRDRRLLSLRFVHEWTQAQIASDFGISQVQVSRLLTRVLSTLRQSMAAA